MDNPISQTMPAYNIRFVESLNHDKNYLRGVFQIP